MCKDDPIQKTVSLSDYIVAFAVANVFVLLKLIAELLRISEKFCFFYHLLHDPFGMLVDMMLTRQCFLEQQSYFTLIRII
jgi:hypothetical protein